MIHTDTAASHANAEAAVRKILERGALPDRALLGLELGLGFRAQP